MAHKRMKPWQKATALVPLALLSGAWTTSIAATSAATADEQGDQPTASSLPDGSLLPAEVVEDPASVSLPAAVTADIPSTVASQAMVRDASPNGIPSAALAAYQRAAQVINSADTACNLSWELLAAIGRVESDHGRYGGNILDDDGNSRPGIYGIPLDGTNNTAKIPDTDAGQYDNDPVWDRAVGPMQFIPSTWAIVGVDANGDGKRDPQNIHDAALASAVYLCSGAEDLATTAGQRTAVFRYNHSNAYVDLVLSLMRAYQSGDYFAVPNGTVSARMLTPNTGDAVVSDGTKGRKTTRKQTGTGSGPGAPGRDTGTTPGGPGNNPGAPDADNGGDDAGETPGSPTKPGMPKAPDPVKVIEDTVDNVTETVEETLSPLEQAIATCQATFTSQELQLLGGLTSCAQQVLDGGLGAVQNLVNGLLGTVGDLVGGLLGGKKG